LNTYGKKNRNVVVLDCNIYLDAARLFDEPFAWTEVQTVPADLAHGKILHPRNPALDSLPAMNYARFGKFGASELEVRTSSHIDKTVRNMAERAAIPDPPGNYSGLGWSAQAAQVYCVMRDRGFLAAYEKGMLDGHSRVMSPGKFTEPGMKALRMNAFDRIPEPRG
jgi:hypothetical protein